MEKKPAKKAGVGSVFAIYLSQAFKHPWLLATAIVGTIVIEVAALVQPLYLRKFINIIATNSHTDAIHSTLVTTIMLIAAFALLERAARQTMLWAVSKFDALGMHELLHVAFGTLMQHSYDFFSSNFGGSLTHKVNKFARSFETISDDIIMNFGPTAMYVFGAIGILYYHNHTLGLMLLVWTIAFILLQMWIVKKMRPLRRERSEADTKQTGAVADSISNHSTVQQFSGIAEESRRLKAISNEWLSKTLRLWNIDNSMWGLLGVFMIGINVALLYAAMLYWQRGLLTVGDFILIQSYLIGTFNNVIGIGRQLRGFFDAFADAGEMVEILHTPFGIADVKEAVPLTCTQALVVFDTVDFSFNKDKQVLKQFNLTITSGEKIALVGSSGAGKSTVTRLLLRFYEVTKGAITIDGQNIAKVTQESLRNAIAFVPQEPILFHRTLMENIRYGRRDATDEQVIEAAKLAHCHEFISELPLAYDTFVGERGIKLSGGERQRVAIARALLKNAPILVLDEATSSLDSESEALIQDALEILMRGKTVVVIAHRLSTIMKMDRIVVMEEGAIAAMGTHLELLSQDGLYKKLWSIQAGGFLKDESEAATTDTDDEDESDDEDSEDEK